MAEHSLVVVLGAARAGGAEASHGDGGEASHGDGGGAARSGGDGGPRGVGGGGVSSTPADGSGGSDPVSCRAEKALPWQEPQLRKRMCRTKTVR